MFHYFSFLLCQPSLTLCWIPWWIPSFCCPFFVAVNEINFALILQSRKSFLIWELHESLWLLCVRVGVCVCECACESVLVRACVSHGAFVFVSIKSLHFLGVNRWHQSGCFSLVWKASEMRCRCRCRWRCDVYLSIKKSRRIERVARVQMAKDDARRDQRRRQRRRRWHQIFLSATRLDALSQEIVFVAGSSSSTTWQWN